MFLLDTVSQEIWIPDEKYHKLCDDIRTWLDGLEISRYSVKGLLTIRGKVISFLIVNPGLKLHIREMTALITIADRDGLDYFSEEHLASSEVFDELDCWLRLYNVKLRRKWYSHEIETIAIHQLDQLTISTDASNYQGGVHIEYGDRPGHIVEMPLFWAPHEAALDIACKEILAVKKTLEQLSDVCGKLLTFKVDNTVVVNSFKNDGCRNLMVTRFQKEILELAWERECHVHLDWISTHLQMADAPSRNILSHIDSRINFSLRIAFKCVFPNGVDLFATLSNRVYHRYCSRYDEFCSESMFVFDSTFSEFDFLYAYPPSGMYSSCIKMLTKFKSNGQSMLIHEFNSNALVHYQARQHFQFRLYVGNRYFPCCLTTGKRLQSNGSTSDYYRSYGEPLRSWIYFRNVSIAQIRRFHRLYLQQRHPLAIPANRKYLRRLFRLWRIIAHRNRCAFHRETIHPDLSSLIESCSNDNPCCLRIEILEPNY